MALPTPLTTMSTDGLRNVRSTIGIEVPSSSLSTAMRTEGQPSMDAGKPAISAASHSRQTQSSFYRLGEAHSPGAGSSIPVAPEET